MPKCSYTSRVYLTGCMAPIRFVNVVVFICKYMYLFCVDDCFTCKRKKYRFIYFAAALHANVAIFSGKGDRANNSGVAVIPQAILCAVIVLIA